MSILLHPLEHHAVIHLSLACEAPSRGRCVVGRLLHVFDNDHLGVRGLPSHAVLLGLNQVRVAESSLALQDLRLLVSLVKNVVSRGLDYHLVLLLKSVVWPLLSIGSVQLVYDLLSRRNLLSVLMA